MCAALLLGAVLPGACRAKILDGRPALNWFVVNSKQVAYSCDCMGGINHDNATGLVPAGEKQPLHGLRPRFTKNGMGHLRA